MCEYVTILSCIDASCCIQRKQTGQKSANEGAKKNKKSVDKGAVSNQAESPGYSPSVYG